MENYEKKYKEALERARQKREEYIRLDNDNVVSKDIEFIFPELKESEDEKIRKWIITFIEVRLNEAGEFIDNYKNAIAWLEKQGEHANFRNKIQVGDKVTRNEDGALVNLSQLERVVKQSEKQGVEKQD